MPNSKSKPKNGRGTKRNTHLLSERKGGGRKKSILAGTRPQRHLLTLMLFFPNGTHIYIFRFDRQLSAVLQ